MLGLLCFASSCGFYVFWSLRVRRSLVLIIVPLSKHINTIFCWPTRIHFWSIIIYLLYGVTDNRKSCFGSEVLECKWEDQLWAKQKWVDFQLLETFLKSSHLPVFAGRIKTQRIGLWKWKLEATPECSQQSFDEPGTKYKMFIWCVTLITWSLKYWCTVLTEGNRCI